MDPQKQSSSLTILAEGLIINAQENLIHIFQRTEEVVHDLQLAQEILAFSQSHTPVSERSRTSNLCGQPYIHNSLIDTSSVYPKLRRCQKYTKLRDIHRNVVEIKKIEVKPVKPRIVY